MVEAGEGEGMHPRAAEDARCAHHPETPSASTCPRCGDFVCAECRPPEGTDPCTRCAAHLRAEHGPRPTSLKLLVALNVLQLVSLGAVIATLISLVSSAQAGTLTPFQEGVISGAGGDPASYSDYDAGYLSGLLFPRLLVCTFYIVGVLRRWKSVLTVVCVIDCLIVLATNPCVAFLPALYAYLLFNKRAQAHLALGRSGSG